jgi:hypothetical protein
MPPQLERASREVVVPPVEIVEIERCHRSS